MTFTAEFSGNELNGNSIRSKLPNKLRWLTQQALFFYFLHVPFQWLRWVLLVALCLLPLISLAHWMESNQLLLLPQILSTAVAILGGVSISVLMLTVFLVIFLLPAQVVHLVTSKQTLLLKSFRCAILFHVFAVPLLHSLVIATLFSVIANKPEAPHFINLFSLIFLLLSSFLHASIYGTQKSAAFPFLLGFMVPVYQYLAYKLNSVDWYLLFALNLASWAVFTFWWLRWKPTAHRAAFITETLSDPTKIQRMQGAFGQGIFSYLHFGLNKNIENLFDGLLLGRAKSPIRIALVSIASPIFFLTVMVLSFSVMPFTTLDSFLEGGKKFTFIFISFLLATPAAQLGVIQFNIKKTWLFYRGKREDFFSALEKLIMAQSFYQIAAVVGLIAIAAYFLDASELQIKLVCLAILFGISEALLIIYLQLFFYHITKARRGFTVNLITFLILFIMLPIGMIVAFMGEAIITKYFSVFWALLITFFVVSIALRFVTKRKWQRIEFLRIS